MGFFLHEEDAGRTLTKVFKDFIDFEGFTDCLFAELLHKLLVLLDCVVSDDCLDVVVIYMRDNRMVANSVEHEGLLSLFLVDRDGRLFFEVVALELLGKAVPLDLELLVVRQDVHFQLLLEG